MGQAFNVPADLLAHFLHGDALAFVADGEGGVIEHDLGALGEGWFRWDWLAVFLISLKARGIGLNLTSANTVIHFDPWWNQSVENQATDRTPKPDDGISFLHRLHPGDGSKETFFSHRRLPLRRRSFLYVRLLWDILSHSAGAADR